MTDLYNGTILCVLLVGDEHLDIIQMSFRHQKFKKNFINVHLVCLQKLFVIWCLHLLHWRFNQDILLKLCGLVLMEAPTS